MRLEPVYHSICFLWALQKFSAYLVCMSLYVLYKVLPISRNALFACNMLCASLSIMKQLSNYSRSKSSWFYHGCTRQNQIDGRWGKSKFSCLQKANIQTRLSIRKVWPVFSLFASQYWVSVGFYVVNSLWSDGNDTHTGPDLHFLHNM